MIGTTRGLTVRQREVFEFIRGRVRETGYPPSVREIGRQFGITSPNGVTCHLKALERKGVIERAGNVARGIRVASSVLLVGRVSAGALVEAIECPERISLEGLFGDPLELQAAIVADDTMLAEGYQAGDCLLRTPDGRTVGMIRRMAA